MTTRTALMRALAPITLALLALTGCSGGGGSGGGGGPSPCTLPTVSSLQVAQMTPAPDSQSVSIAASVSLRFNACVDLSTVTSTTVQLIRAGTFTPVAVTRTYDAATATLTLDPVANLVAGAWYDVTVFPLVRGARAESMTTAYSESFRTRTTPDVTAPTTTASPPGSRYRTPQLVSLSCSDGADGGGCARSHYTLDGSTPTVLSAVYTAPITVDRNLTIRFFSVDNDGNVEALRSEAYVIDTTPPTILSIYPDDGEVGVPRTVRIRAQFSEEMAVGTLGPANVTVSPSQERTISWDGSTDTLTITPRRRLDCGTTYAVTFGTGVQDIAGNGLTAPVSSSFTVHEDCEEPATTASLEDGVYVSSQSVTLSCTDTGGSGCARIVYTLDGTVPSLDPVNGTVVSGANAGPIAIGVGDTVLRFHAEDAAGNREVVREERYSVSTTGFTYVATGNAIARGIGPIPASFVTLEGGGVTNAFFRDATNGRLYRAAERGLFASNDGVSWTKTRLLDASGSAARVTAVYAQGSVIFAGTSSGLFRSEDGGATFEHLDAGRSSPPWISDIDGEGRHVYVGSNAGLRISHDRGETFVEGGDLTTYYYDVDVEPGTGRVFVATSSGLELRTHAGGATLNYNTGTVPQMPSSAVRAVVVTPAAVYAGTEAGLAVFARDGAGHPVWSSNKTTANGLGDNFISDLAVEGSTIYAVTGPPYYSGSANSFSVSTNGGVSFSPRAFAPPVTNRIAAAVHVEGTNVYVGAQPGWFLSTDGAVNFAQKDLTGAVRITGSGSTLYAGTDGPTGDDGILVSTDGFRTFVGRGERHGMGQGGGSVDDLVVSGNNVYAATGWGLAISTDGADSFTLRSKNNGAGLWDLSVDCVAVQPGKIWACALNSLDLSINGGTSFTSKLNIGSALPRAIAASGSNVYFATSMGVRVTNDGGTTFFTRSTASGLTAQPQDLALAPDGAVYVATDDGVFVSIDDGATFSRIAGVAATDWVYSVDAAVGVLYVGIGNKLGVSVDDGTSFVWRDASHGLPGTPRETWYQP